MPTFTALTTLTGKDRAETLGEAMERLDPAPTGVGFFEVEDGKDVWEVGGYFSQAPDQAALALLAAAFAASPFEMSELPKTDWVAHVRRELAPIRAGRFFLYGSHDAGTLPEGAVTILVDAALAFGTGHHGTTKGCLIALDRLARKGVVVQNVADIGCGTAVLAMAAAKLWPKQRILASDIDRVAVETAVANVALNGLAGQVDCLECSGFNHAVLRDTAPFDLVFANILKAPLLALAPDMAKHVAAGGVAILSGILNAQADEVIAAYQTEGFALRESDQIGDWTTLSLAKLPL
jgi:ribosomal protein L11 methyltransferase